MRKHAFCICTADHRLCFRYIVSTIPLLVNPKFQASSHLLWLDRQVCVGPGRKCFLVTSFHYTVLAHCQYYFCNDPQLLDVQARANSAFPDHTAPKEYHISLFTDHTAWMHGYIQKGAGGPDPPRFSRVWVL